MPSSKRTLILGRKTTLFQISEWTTTFSTLTIILVEPRHTALETMPDVVKHGRLLPSKPPFLPAILLGARPKLLLTRSFRRIPILGRKTISFPTLELIMTSLTPITTLMVLENTARLETVVNSGKLLLNKLLSQPVTQLVAKLRQLLMLNSKRTLILGRKIISFLTSV
jgi:hypothetical protein